MVEATKIVTFDSAHRLLKHPGKCMSLHGHTYKLEVTFQAQELHNGMVYDFGDMKKVLSIVIDKWDHMTILEEGDPLIEALSPIAGISLTITPDRPTAENMVFHIRNQINRMLPEDVHVSKAVLWETPTSFVTWEIRR